MKTYAGFLISRIRHLSGRWFEKLLKDSGIDAFNGAQGRILYVLWENGTLSISEISRLTSLANTTLTSMLDRMEAQGLITRAVNPQNRRQIQVSLTEKALALRSDYDRVSDDVNDVFFEGFTEAEIRQFEDMLRRIIANYEKRD